MGKPMNKGFINWCLSSAGLLDSGKTELDDQQTEKSEEVAAAPVHHHHHHRGHYGRHHHRHHDYFTGESTAEPGVLSGFSQLGTQMFLLALTTMAGWAVFALCWCKKRSSIENIEVPHDYKSDRISLDQTDESTSSSF